MIVSVIIPVYNDPRLETCLESLSRQTLPTDQIEVLVIDNGSDEPPRELVERYPFARLLMEPTPGAYAARNCGLKVASGDVFAFTDSDCVPSAEWLSAGVMAIEAAEAVVAIGGRMDVFPRDANRPKAVELVDIAYAFNQERTIREFGYAVTANLLAPRAAFERVGSFNQELLSGGDGEWCHRAAEVGVETTYCADAVVAHPARARVADIIRKKRRTVAGRLVRNRERSRLSFLRTVARHILPDIGRIARGRRRLIERGFGGGAWLKLAWVVLVVQYAGVFEYLRLRLGGAAERR